MPANWTAPITWNVNQLVTADNLNQQLRDNLEFLKSPPTASVVLDQSSDYNTTATSFVNIDSSVLSLSLTTAGGALLIGFHGVISPTGTHSVYLDITVDGVRVGGDDGLLSVTRATTGTTPSVSFVRLVTGITAGAHTVRLQWKVSAGTSTLYAGAGTTGNDTHPQFWAREVS